MTNTLPNVVIIGRPNVGKSTLFNRLVGKREAIESQVPGTTRDRLFGEVTWRDKKFNLIDVAGIEYGAKEEIEKNIQLSIMIALETADLVLFVVDWNEKSCEKDKKIASLLRRSKLPVILVVNKADNLERMEDVSEFQRFGNFEIIPISSISGKNTGDLLDKIDKHLPKQKKIEQKKEEAIDLAIIGRPNVGKSTLLNTIIGEKRAVVSEIPGTTRDKVKVEFFHKGKKINIVDTAGIRRPGKIKWDSLEKFSLLRTQKVIRESDIVVLMIDGEEGLVATDMHILGEAKELGKGVVLAVNKIDLWGEEKDKKMAETIYDFQRKLNFIPWAPIVFISGKDDENIKPLLNQVVAAEESRNSRIPQEDLDKVLEAAKEANDQLVGIKSLEQKRTKPPILIAKYKGRAPHVTQMRYLENRLRDNYPLYGTPIFIDLYSTSKRK